MRILPLSAVLVSLALSVGSIGPRAADRKTLTAEDSSPQLQPATVTPTKVDHADQPAADQMAVSPALNPAAGNQVSWLVVASGGGRSLSPAYGLSQAIGQTAFGTGSSAGYGINQGFWQEFESQTSCCGLYTGGYTGNTDCDTDGKMNLQDVTRLIDRIYLSQVLLCCEENGDTNGDNTKNLQDVTRIIDHIYLSKLPTAKCQ